MNTLNSYPDWVRTAVSKASKKLSPEGVMDLALEIACLSARSGGGPFAAVIADAQGAIRSVGWNTVVTTFDSTAHAEINAIRRLQSELRTHDLSTVPELRLYSSGAPCIQCFGAIYWSGLREIYSCATKAEAERIGFHEGPVSPELWAFAENDKQIRHYPAFNHGERADEPFRIYRELNAVIY